MLTATFILAIMLIVSILSAAAFMVVEIVTDVDMATPGTIAVVFAIFAALTMAVLNIISFGVSLS